MTNQEFGDILGINESSIRGRIERRSFDPDELEKIARYFKKPIAWLFDCENEVSMANEDAVEYSKPCARCRELEAELAVLTQKYIALLEGSAGIVKQETAQ